MSTTMDFRFNLGLVQMSMEPCPQANLNTAFVGIREAAGRGAEMVCLPELFRSPYFCANERSQVDYLERDLPKLQGKIASLAQELGVTIVAGSLYVEDSGGKRFNSAFAFGPDGSLLGEFQKTHIPHDPGFYEGNYFSGGESGYTIFKTSVRGREVKFGVLICYDQWFPEAARAVALQGAEVIFYPTAIGTVDGIPQREGDWHKTWKVVQQGHAGTNNVVIATVNRVGKEGAINFWGGSFVCDAWAKVLKEAGDSPEVVVAEINLEDSKFVRDNWGFMRARRPETYGILCKKQT